MDGRAECARDLVLAIFRLAVCDYLGLSYGHDGPDRPRSCQSRRDTAEVALFLSGARAAQLAEMAGFRSELVWREARSTKRATIHTLARGIAWGRAA